MTERLYYTDSKILNFEASIISSGKTDDDRFYTVLDKTAFYPTSGGQLFDRGKLNQVDIIDVLEVGDEIHHISKYPVGEQNENVSGSVEPLRRIYNCQQHTAQHLLSHIFHKHFNMATVSVHLGDEYGLVEFDRKKISDDILEEAEQLTNKLIADNYPVKINFIDSSELDKIELRRETKRSGKIRVIQIGDFEYSACGGTHCETTSEAMLVKIIGIEKVHGNAGVKFLCGLQAIQDYSERFKITDVLIKSLTCHLSDIPDSFDKLNNELKDAKKQITALTKQLLPVKADDLASKKEDIGGVNTVISEASDVDSKSVNQLAPMVAEKINGTAVLAFENRIIISSVIKDSSQIAKSIAEKFSLKGGGSQKLAQLAASDKIELNKYRESIIEILKN